MGDWRKLLFTLSQTPNVFRISNEIAYSGHHGVLLTPKEYCLEAILTRVAFETRNLSTLTILQNIIISKLHADCSNIKEIIFEIQEFL